MTTNLRDRLVKALTAQWENETCADAYTFASEIGKVIDKVLSDPVPDDPTHLPFYRLAHCEEHESYKDWCARCEWWRLRTVARAQCGFAPDFPGANPTLPNDLVRLAKLCGADGATSLDEIIWFHLQCFTGYAEDGIERQLARALKKRVVK